MVRRRCIAQPSRSPRPRSRRRDLTGRPLSSPVWQPPDRSASPTSDGWDDRCVPLSYKKGNPPAVLPLPSLACFRIWQYRHSYFPLRLVLANSPLAHSRCFFAHSPGKLFSRLRRPPLEEVGRRPRRGTPAASPTMPQFVEMFESLRWTLAAMYLCIVGGVCLLLVFHLHIHRPLPHELR
jgi:hypothetical protein